VQALDNSLKEVLSFCLIFFIVWLTFVQAIYVIYFDKSIKFSTFLRTLITCFQMIFGRFNVKEMLETNLMFTFLLYIPYNIVIVFVLINIMLSILANHFEAVRNNKDLSKQDPELFNYVKFMIVKFIPKLSKNENKIQPLYVDSIEDLTRRVDRLIIKIDSVIFKKIIFPKYYIVVIQFEIYF